MKRRNFLKILPPLGVTPFVMNGMAMKPFANSKIAGVLSSCEGIEDRTLVLIQMSGGNDGMNMVVPVPQYDRYAELRPTVKLDLNSLIMLDATLPNGDQVGLHPNMTGVKALYDRGYASIVQAVGYSSMNQSHFKGTDLWLSGGGGSSALNNIPTGWMGRSLQALYPDVYGAPTAGMLDPLGIELGSPTSSLGFHTETEHKSSINLSGQDPAGFYSLVQTIGGAPITEVPDTDHGHELEYIMNVERSMDLYSQRITQVFGAGTNAKTYPNNSFANQLKTIARMVKGGCKTKIFLCQIGGFDTHATQVDITNTSVGSHANLMKTLSDGIQTFFDDLDAMGLSDRVMACTFSEFGRCAKENGTNGTDHGTLAPMMVFGKAVRPKVHGTNVNLNDLTTDNQVKNLQFDYRQIFATLLQDWLGANPHVMEEGLIANYQKMFLVEKAMTVNPACYYGGSPTVSDIFKPATPLTLAPNPASVTVEVTYEAERPFEARMSLYGLNGRLVTTSTEYVYKGTNVFYLDVSSLPVGIFFLRMEDKISGKADIVRLSVIR
jgi:uncharacterized protein (DUF1501 family)